jgi:hypothetical protein
MKIFNNLFFAVFKPKEKKLQCRLNEIIEFKYIFISLRNAEKFEDLLNSLDKCINDLNLISGEVQKYPDLSRKYDYLLSRLEFRRKEVLHILNNRSRKIEESRNDLSEEKRS